MHVTKMTKSLMAAMDSIYDVAANSVMNPQRDPYDVLHNLGQQTDGIILAALHLDISTFELDLLRNHQISLIQKLYGNI